MQLKTILINKLAHATLAAAVLALAGCGALRSPSILPGRRRPGCPGLAAASGTFRPCPALPAILLLGEQHDAPAHQQWERDTIQTLARDGRLAAVVLEMAHAGTDSRALDRNPSENDVQAALQWNAAGWPGNAMPPW
jgi:hypothetical protein